MTEVMENLQMWLNSVANSSWRDGEPFHKANLALTVAGGMENFQKADTLSANSD